MADYTPAIAGWQTCKDIPVQEREGETGYRKKKDYRDKEAIVGFIGNTTRVFSQGLSNILTTGLWL